MIRYTEGNMLEASAEALVNTVNEVGVMGKGIALMFREAYPDSSREYQQACRRGEVQVGSVLVTSTNTLFGPRWIIHFPTKKHWRNPSRLEWIRAGLTDLAKVIREHGITSIAVPPLGCGNGGLEWADVRAEIEKALSVLEDVEIIVYQPTTTYHHIPKRRGLEKLTPARALIAELIRRYSVLGIECSNLEVHKLAWFMQRMVVVLGIENPLQLRFAADKYGPYADQLRHLLDGLDGSYLHCRKRLADAGAFDAIWFEDSKRDVVGSYLSQNAAVFMPALEATAEIIGGFESPLGMELLASVDWLILERKQEASVAGVRKGLRSWPGGQAAARRKLKLFDDRMLALALDRLKGSRLHESN